MCWRRCGDDEVLEQYRKDPRMLLLVHNARGDAHVAIRR